jgi:hypothetical protein
MDANSSFNPVFSALRSILAEYEPGLDIMADEPGYYYLNTRTLGPNKRPISFGGVRIGKVYVSYYLMCAYAGNVQLGMSPALKRRMQGKACFNFKSVDPELFDELRAVTRTGYEAWKTLGWVG